jgi:hypothetical protein
MRVMRMREISRITILSHLFHFSNAHGHPCFAKGNIMSAYQKSLPWFKRPARSLIAAPRPGSSPAIRGTAHPA